MIIYYDGECPFCASYVSHLRLKAAVGAPTLINIREDAAAHALLAQKGFVLDNGMVVEYGDTYYHGADAVNMMALLSTPSGVFNRLNSVIFSTRLIARLLYPFMRAVRNATLFWMGRAPIEPEAETQTHHQYSIFACLLGLFSVYHFIIYISDYRIEPIPTGWLSMMVGTALFLYPASKRLFVLLILILSADGWIHAPAGSNHTIILNFLLLGILSSGLWHVLSNRRSWDGFYESFAPIGRCLLLCMYFFGIFHKINSDFLNPVSSCATTLLHQIPIISAFADQLWLQYSAIYGTFLVEGAVMLCLMNRRYHYYGVSVGILFHIILATSAYQFYPTFSTLSIMLHCLFIPKQTLTNFKQSAVWAWLCLPFSRVKIAIVFLCLIVLQLAINFDHSPEADRALRTLPWLVFATAIFLLVVKYSYLRNQTQPQDKAALIARPLFLNLISALFFLSCASPYLGLKTSQSINMFANLRLEGGQSNHLLMPVPRAFPYLNDLVRITDVSSESSLHFYLQTNHELVYYSLLNILETEPATKVSFMRHGTLYKQQDYQSLHADAQMTLHPRWVRKWLHFNPVTLTEPKTCSPYN